VCVQKCVSVSVSMCTHVQVCMCVCVCVFVVMQHLRMSIYASVFT